MSLTAPIALCFSSQLSLISYLKLLQDRRVLPQLLPPSDLEEIFRRVYFLTGGATVAIEDLTYSQFVDAICMTAMALYDQPKFYGQYQTLEAKLEAFFSILCGFPVPRAAPLPLEVEQVCRVIHVWCLNEVVWCCNSSSPYP